MPEKDSDREMPEKETRSIKAEIWSWVKCILIGIILALILDFLVIANARVPTGSMEDTIPAVPGSSDCGMPISLTNRKEEILSYLNTRMMRACIMSSVSSDFRVIQF